MSIVTTAPPVSEQISQSLLATLQTVTKAAGYNLTLEAVRFTHADMQTVPGAGYDALGVLHDRGDDAGKAVNSASDGGANGWGREYHLVIFIPPQTDSGIPWDTLANVARADVEKAVMADVNQGGIVENTYLTGAAHHLDGPYSVTVMWVCEYKVEERDPYTRRTN